MDINGPKTHLVLHDGGDAGNLDGLGDVHGLARDDVLVDHVAIGLLLRTNMCEDGNKKCATKIAQFATK